ncbi:glycosyltransferase [Pseudomonas helleri]|uniref:glycosyltransferase n=1 Tax=Pseudomonas helleri TaxID=1608996 RepID=UPI0028EC52CB|nr:glycosyltransferase [Pseudomonas helleri]
MKILYLITGLGVGGAERQVLDLADRLYEQGQTVKICYLTGPVLLRPKHEEIELVGLELEKTVSGFIKGALKLRSVIKAYDPDVVHAHMVHANLLSRVVRLVCPIKKLINTAHNTNEGGKLRMLAYRFTHPLTDAMTNVTLEAVKVFEQKKAAPPGGIFEVSNGIDTTLYRPDKVSGQRLRDVNGICDQEKLIVAVGRLEAAKDYENLINAFGQLSKNFTDTKLWIVGEGSERQKLTDLVLQLNLSHKITFLGVRSDVANIYNAADLYVLSSAWEGFGLVVAEAMSSERVVVVTDCGGVKEVVGECGYLVPAQNSLALKNAITDALNISNVEAENMGRLARKRIVDNYSIDKIVGVWLGIYRT